MAILIVITAVSAVSACITYVCKKHHLKKRLTHDAQYDMPYDYIQSPLPPRTHSTMDSELYDTIPNHVNTNAESISGVRSRTQETPVQGTQEDVNSVEVNVKVSAAKEHSIDMRVRMQENSSYQLSNNFVYANNPAYGTNIANAPEIPSNDNIAYQ